MREVVVGQVHCGAVPPYGGCCQVEWQPRQGRRATERSRCPGPPKIIFQDPYSSLNPRMSVRETLTEALRVHKMVEPKALDVRCNQLLDTARLSARIASAYPRQLSGGQRQRVCIARALAVEPDLLIADEPVSSLDVSVQATILNLLAELRRELGLTLLLIAHNMAVVRHVCERTAVMYLGRIVERGPTEQLFSNPRHPYTRALLAAVPRLVPGRRSPAPALHGDPPSPINLPAGCRFEPRCPLAEGVCTVSEPELERGEADLLHFAACHFAWKSSGTSVSREPGSGSSDTGHSRSGDTRPSGGVSKAS